MFCDASGHSISTERDVGLYTRCLNRIGKCVHLHISLSHSHFSLLSLSLSLSVSLCLSLCLSLSLSLSVPLLSDSVSFPRRLSFYFYNNRQLNLFLFIALIWLAFKGK